MRTKVTFTYPVPPQSPEREFSENLPVAQAGWFTGVLSRIERAEVDGELRQEDWFVVAFLRRDDCGFWIGLGWYEDETEFLAHVHHGSRLPAVVQPEGQDGA